MTPRSTRVHPYGAAGVPVGELLEAMLSQTGYVEALEAERTIEAQGRIENLEQLVEVGARVRRRSAAEGEDTLDVFLQQIALVADADTRSDDEGLVTLMTLHNAKGLEYPIVFIAGCEDGVFPHSRAIEEGGLEEERRLFYVGITRAMRQLYLTYARRRAVFGAQTYGMRSRFLDEIPADLLEEPRQSASSARAPCPLARRRWGFGRDGSSRLGHARLGQRRCWPSGGARGTRQSKSLLASSAWARTSSTQPSATGWSPGSSQAG